MKMIKLNKNYKQITKQTSDSFFGEEVGGFSICEVLSASLIFSWSEGDKVEVVVVWIGDFWVFSSLSVLLSDVSLVHVEKYESSLGCFVVFGGIGLVFASVLSLI